MEVESFFHVACKTEDVDDAAAFYRECLGAGLLEWGHPTGEEGAEAVEYAALLVGDKRLYLFDRAPYEATGLVDSLPTGFLHFGYVVDDVERAFRELAAAGAEFLVEPKVFGDLEVAYFYGPDGVRVELVEHLDG
jgi:catechol 2,3-dioxygenase-like lactoylglutathione lyase family enzyme